MKGLGLVGLGGLGLVGLGWLSWQGWSKKFKWNRHPQGNRMTNLSNKGGGTLEEVWQGKFDNLNRLHGLAKGSSLGPEEAQERVVQEKDGSQEKRRRQEILCVNKENPAVTVLIVYGTEYGCSKELAYQLKESIENTWKGGMGDGRKRVVVRVVDLENYEWITWEKERIILIICSTYGDGVPPTTARRGYEYLLNEYQTRLQTVYFSVLALGDSNYPHFCRSGRQLDERMQELGAMRLASRTDVDQEDADVIEGWMERICHRLENIIPNIEETYTDYLTALMQGNDAEGNKGYSRLKPLFATVKEKRILTNSVDKEDKITIHIEFDVSNSAVRYECGDSLGIVPQNDPVIVDELLHHLHFRGDEPVFIPDWHYLYQDITPRNGEQEPSLSLRKTMINCYDLKTVKPEFLRLLQVCATNVLDIDRISDLFRGGRTTATNMRLAKFLEDRDLLDVLREFPSANRIHASALLKNLKPLLPRYYSISSSPLIHENTISITVAVVYYEFIGRVRKGVCSTQLFERLSINDLCPIFVNNNPDFRLPKHAEVPLIMVGPGTGLAPFMGFLQERKAQDSSGELNLYFGCRHSEKDFLYKDELLALVDHKKLMLFTAFSREGKKKVYVQDRLRENGQHVWSQLQTGAFLYICGDAKYMAPDVHKALVEIAVQHGHLSNENASHYFDKLITEKRYQKDVWL